MHWDNILCEYLPMTALRLLNKCCDDSAVSVICSFLCKMLERSIFVNMRKI